MLSTYYNRNNIATYIVYALVFMYVVIMTSLTPLQLDDLAFMNLYLEKSGGYEGLSIKGIVGFFESMRENDNSRISNQLAPIFALVTPFKQIFPILNGLCVCGIIWIISKWCKREKSQLFILCVWVTMVLFLPWRDQLFCQDFALNYIFAGFITLYDVYLICKFEKRGWKLTNLFYVIFVSILAGGWHEGFAFPTLGGLFICAFRHNFKMTRFWYTVVFLYFISALFFALSQGMLDRMGREDNIIGIYSYLRMIFTLCLPLILYITVLLVMAKDKSPKPIFKIIFANNVTIVFFISSILACIIFIIFDHSARTAFYPCLSAIIVFFMLINHIKIRIHKFVHTFIYVFCGLFLSIQAVSSLIWQYKLYEENRIIMKLIKESKTGTIFYDMILPEDIPFYTLFFPSRSVWESRVQMRYLRIFFNNNSVAIVPEELRDARSDNNHSLGDGLYIHNDKLYSDEDFSAAENDKNLYFNIEMKNGKKIYYQSGFLVKFINDYGKDLYYIRIPRIDTSEIKSLILIN